jgi:DNA-directed RNA polymerase specialized sigma24 family protein
MLDALVGSLPEPLGAVLVAHVVEGKTKTEIARALGVSRRTMVRYWQDIRAHAADVLGDAMPGRTARRQARTNSGQCPG